MAQPVTEVVYLPTKPGLDIESGEGKRVWESTVATIIKQPGVRKLYAGKQLEIPDVLQIVAGTFNACRFLPCPSVADSPSSKLFGLKTHTWKSHVLVLHP